VLHRLRKQLRRNAIQLNQGCTFHKGKEERVVTTSAGEGGRVYRHLFVTMRTPKGPSQSNINSGTPKPRPSIVTHCATNPSQDQQSTCRHTRLQQNHATRHKANRARPMSRTCTGFQPSVEEEGCYMGCTSDYVCNPCNTVLLPH
jgi:hypothetical protein